VSENQYIEKSSEQKKYAGDVTATASRDGGIRRWTPAEWFCEQQPERQIISP
jgi:hypothetical protein